MNDNPVGPQSHLRISSVEVLTNDVLIRFPTVPGRLYRLERTESLNAGLWQTASQTILGDGGVRLLVDPAGANHISRFYRLRVD